MDMSPISENSFKRGCDALAIGKHQNALNLFRNARSENEVPSTDIEHQLGICYALAGKTKEANESFNLAFKHAKTNEQRIQVRRDHGILYLRTKPKTALHNFTWALERLKDTKKVTEDEKSLLTGLVLLAKGKSGEAYPYLLQTPHNTSWWILAICMAF